MAIFNFEDEVDAIYIVDEGFIKILGADQQQADLSHTIHGIAGPREIFGLTDVLNFRSHHLYEAVALTPCKIKKIPLYKLPNPENSHWIIPVLSGMSAKKTDEARMIQSLQGRPAITAVSGLLAYAFNHYGESSRFGYRLKSFLGHASMAEILGISRETVSRSLSALQQSGVISRRKIGEHTMYVTKDVAVLAEFSAKRRKGASGYVAITTPQKAFA